MLPLWMIALSWIKKLVVNPIFLIGLALVLSFSAGWIYKGRSMEKAQLKADLEQIQQVEVKSEKIHRKYDRIKLDTVADLERLLSYEAFSSAASGAASVSKGQGEPGR